MYIDVASLAMKTTKERERGSQLIASQSVKLQQRTTTSVIVLPDLRLLLHHLCKVMKISVITDILHT